MVRQLSDEGYILAVCTNGTNGYVRKIVSALELAPLFLHICRGRSRAVPNPTR